jgi:hypothetical protein
MEFGKLLLPCDINNLRSEVTDTAVPACWFCYFVNIFQTVASLEELGTLVSRSGLFQLQKDENGRILCLSFSRNEQIDLFSRYPEVICMDATYNTNRFGLVVVLLYSTL